MSYTPDDQQLSQPIDSIVAGIDEFCKSANKRIDNPSEWSSDHLDELVDIVTALAQFRLRLRRLQTSTT